MLSPSFSLSQPPRRRGFSGLLSFRRAAIVVLASNRLRLLGHATKSNKSHSLLLAEFPRKGKKAPMLVGRKEATPAWMTSTKTKNDDGDEAQIESRLFDWFVSIGFCIDANGADDHAYPLRWHGCTVYSFTRIALLSLLRLLARSLARSLR